MEGTYFRSVNPTPGTGIASAVTTAFSATAGILTVRNTSSVTGAQAVNIYPDYIKLLVLSGGTGGTSVDALVAIDNTNRYASGGTSLAGRNVHSLYTANTSVASSFIGAVVSAVETANVARVSRVRLKSAVPAAGDNYMINFGSNGVSQADCGPVVIGPGGTMVVHLWMPSSTVALTVECELGWWER